LHQQILQFITGGASGYRKVDLHNDRKTLVVVILVIVVDTVMPGFIIAEHSHIL